MGYLGDILRPLASIIDSVLFLYLWIVIISALLSWVNPDPYNPIVRILRGLTEPAFNWIRRKLPFVFIGGIDLSPLVLILGVQLVKSVLVGWLMRVSYQMG